MRLCLAAFASTFKTLATTNRPSATSLHLSHTIFPPSSSGRGAVVTPHHLTRLRGYPCEQSTAVLSVPKLRLFSTISDLSEETYTAADEINSSSSSSAQSVGDISPEMARTKKKSTQKEAQADFSLLASEWTKILVKDSKDATGRSTPASLEGAARRTIPLLFGGDDAATVPFLCRYRTDVIDPLTPAQVHQLREWVERYSSLKSLRARSLQALDEHHPKRESRGGEYEELKRRMSVSTSKSELDELYAPFKPPAKGSLAERIAAARPDFVDVVERFWRGELPKDRGELERIIGRKHGKADASLDMSPRDCVVSLIGSKIAANPTISDTVMDISRRQCVVSTKKAASEKATKKGGNRGNKRSKYERFFDFSQRTSSLQDHDVLAIRRGVNAKELRMANAVPNTDYVIRRIKQTLLEKVVPPASVDQCRRSGAVMKVVADAVEDSWSRLLKRRTSCAVWRDKVSEAERRSIAVFSENVRSALMVPPQKSPTHVLAIDPGHRAGTKVALLNPKGELLSYPDALSTITFLGSERQEAIEKLSGLLGVIKHDVGCSTDAAIIVALGNGHGSDESRSLIEEASSASGISIDVFIVDEAGASVWSVTEAAATEFPCKPPASIGAISIGRRLQDPMNELVKVPPRSLGLGMYQHDLPEHDLDEHLKHASVDAVSLVGVDANSCSLELLRNVPGLSKGKLAEGVIAARPITCREDLLKKVKGLGPKCFENCAGFVRIRPGDGSELLDSTRCHPESYPVARWIMKKSGCDLTKIKDKVALKDTRKGEWEKLIHVAARHHGISTARVENIINLLIDSSDPRLSQVTPGAECQEGKLSHLPRNLASNMQELRDACPVRNVLGTVRNIADFGAFVDIGAENNGLLHVSKMGPVGRSGMTIGMRVGVDIVGVETETGRISLSAAGLGCDAISYDVLSQKRKGPAERKAAKKKAKRNSSAENAPTKRAKRRKN